MSKDDNYFNRKEEIHMAKRRANGEGSIRKRADGRWEGRYTAGYNSETGKWISKNVLGKTQAEVKEKLARAITPYPFPRSSSHIRDRRSAKRRRRENSVQHAGPL